MKAHKAFIFGIFALLLVATGCKKDEPAPVAFRGFQPPAHFPAPTYPVAVNPVTEAGFYLGKKLFYDGILSRDGTISCGSCHIQYSAFTHHGHNVSHGIEDRLGTRNAPAVQNMAFQRVFFWDGGVHNLDLLSIAPIENPLEMDETTANVLQKLRAHGEYPALFAAVFGDEEITTARLLQALSQFMLMLVSANSRYDAYIKGDESALTAEELRGLAAFRAKCENCHREPLFTDDSFRYTGLFRTGDKGRFHVSMLSEDEYKFKVPSLRNLGYSAPYMHDGRMRTLDEVLAHYAENVSDYPTLDSSLRQSDGSLGIALTVQERADIKAFLSALDDESFVRDTIFSE